MKLQTPEFVIGHVEEPEVVLIEMLWVQNRCVKIFTGHQHNFEKNLLKCNWSPDGQKVTSGSADRMVYIWDTTSRRILYKVWLLHMAIWILLKFISE